VADNVWNNSQANNNGNDPLNWSLGWVPKAGDVAVYDSGTTSDNCTFSGNVTTDGMRFDNVYAGTVDAATHDITLGANGLDCTGGGSATLDLGLGKWTITGGNLDFEDLGTLIPGTAEVEMLSTGTIKSTANGRVYDLTIASGATTTVWGNQRHFGTLDTLDIYGTLALNKSMWMGVASVLNLYSGGVFGDGSDTLFFFGQTSGGIATLEGTLNLSNLALYNMAPGCVWAASDYSGADVRVEITGSNSGTWRLSAGSYAFGSLEWTLTGATSSLSVDLSTNDPTVTIQTLTIDVDSSVDVTISPGANGLIVEGDLVRQFSNVGGLVANSCPITFTGTNDQDIDGCGGTWGTVTENKTAGTVTLSGTLTCGAFTGTDGDFDLNGQTLTASGAVDFASGFTLGDMDGTINCDTFSADGQTLNGAATWYLNATTSGTATGTTFTNCDASGGAEIDASDGTCTDGGGNSNVRFWTDPTCTITTAITMPANSVTTDVTRGGNTITDNVTIGTDTIAIDVGMGCGNQG